MHSLTRKRRPEHTYFIFEAEGTRLQKSLSDLGGTDVYAHEGTASGVFREIGNALLRAEERPTMKQMLATLDKVRVSLSSLIGDVGAKTVFSPRVYRDLVLAANENVKSIAALS